MTERILTPSRRSMVEITNDIVGVREALYDATGSALLAREKCKAEDARIIYEALCRANNVLWTVVEELQAFPSEKEPMYRVVEGWPEPVPATSSAIGTSVPFIDEDGKETRIDLTRPPCDKSMPRELIEAIVRYTASMTGILPNENDRKYVNAALLDVAQIAQRSAIEPPERKRLVYNKVTKRIDVVRPNGLVVDSFEPPQECDGAFSDGGSHG